MSGAVVSTTGDIDITGTATGSGNNQYGVTLSSVSRVVTQDGTVIVSGTGSATGDAAITTHNGVLLFAGTDRIESTGSGEITINATGGTNSVGLQSAGPIGGSTASGDITLNVDSMILSGMIQSTGNLSIVPTTPDIMIGIGTSGVTAPINVATSQLLDGFASIMIGDTAAGTGVVIVDDASFSDPVTIVGGTILVSNGLTGDGGITLTTVDAAAGGQDIGVTSGIVTDTSGSVAIDAGDNVVIASGVTVSAPAAGATLAITVDAAPDVDAVGATVSLGGVLTSDAGTTITGGSDIDSISITSAAASLMMAATGADSGNLLIDGETIAYSAIESVNTTQAIGDVNVTFAAAETLAISQMPSGSIELVSSLGPVFQVTPPGNSLTIDTGTGADTVNVSSIDIAIGDLFIQASGADDVVNLNESVVNSSGGFEIVAGEINVAAAISTVDAMVLGDPGVAGTSVNLNGGSLTAGSLLQLDNPVNVAADTTITAGSLIDFTSTVDGVGNLTASAGSDVVFSADVGGLTPLGGLLVSSSGGIVRVPSHIRTQGDQTFASPVEPNVSGPTTFESTGGSVTFQSTLDDTMSPSNLSVISSGPAVFQGDVGSINPPTTMSVTSGGPFLFSTTMSAVNGVAIEVLDTAGADDDLTVSGAIALVDGNLSLIAGDDVEIQASALLSGNAILVNVDPAASDPDANGGTVTVAGTISGPVSVSGGDDADTFTPQSAGTFLFNGGAPTSSPGDTINVAGADGTVIVTPTRVTVPSVAATIDISSVEDVNVVNGTGIDVTGDIDEVFTVSAIPTTTRAAVATNGGPTVTFDTTITNNAVLRGSDGDDTLVVDVSGGLPGGTYDFRGGLNANTDPGDQILLQGAAPTAIDSLSFFYTNLNDGSIEIDGTTVITYTGLEPITSSIDAANVYLTYSGVAESIVATQVGNDVTVNSDAGEVTMFAAPSNNLAIDTGGGMDDVTVNGLSLDLASEFSIVDPDLTPDDSVSFETNPTTITTGSLTVATPRVDVTADLSVDGGVGFGIAGAGEIRTGATITAGSAITFGEPVTLVGDSTFTTTDGIDFVYTVNGPHNLVLDAVGDGVQFLDTAGDLVPLTSLTVAPGGARTLLNAAVTTTADQSYGSPVSTDAGGTSVALTSSGGRVSFGSTVDNAASLPDSLVVSSAGIASFAGSVGGSGTPFDLVDVTSAGPLVLASNITATSGIVLNVVETSGADDDLVIQSPAALMTGISGAVQFQVGDDVDIQAGSTIETQSLMVEADPSIGDLDIGTGANLVLNGTLLVTNGTDATGGDDVDAFDLIPQAGSAIRVVGNDPTTFPGDSLRINGGGLDVTFDVGTGEITGAGVQPVTTTGIENLTFSNIGVLTVNGGSGFDVATIANDPSVDGGDLLTINTGFPIAIDSVTSLVFNGLDGDDTFNYDATGGVVTTPVTFNGGLADGSGSGDFLQILGLFTTQTLNYTPRAPKVTTAALTWTVR